MQKVFDNPSQLEALAKQKYGFPDFIMMENAALALKKLILEKKSVSQTKCLILCGKGNNGGDGYALARLIKGKLEPLVFTLEAPVAAEAKTQYTMCKKMGIPFITKKALLELLNEYENPQPCGLIIVDCLYGTGFKGQLAPKVLKIIEAANKAQALRIACDISSALAFNANYTLTMGEQKLALYSDKAKAMSGKIIVANLGLERSLFENVMPAAPHIHLIEPQDLKLPLRTNKAAHKGTFGHTAVFAGEKSGAAIISATAAMNFGSGLTSLIELEHSNLKQFKISPELMISTAIPAKTSCIVCGPGLEKSLTGALEQISTWIKSSANKNPAVVFDAGVFGNENFINFLQKIQAKANARIVLTPHILEFYRFCKSLKIFPKQMAQISVETLTEDPQIKILLGQKINSLFPNVTLVIKSANTFIVSGGQIYIINDGTPSLAKGGSGDALAGMIASLLAQGYSAKDAAISACEAHALAGKKHGSDAYDLTPLKLCR